LGRCPGANRRAPGLEAHSKADGAGYGSVKPPERTPGSAATTFRMRFGIEGCGERIMIQAQGVGIVGRVVHRIGVQVSLLGCLTVGSECTMIMAGLGADVYQIPRVGGLKPTQTVAVKTVHGVVQPGVAVPVVTGEHKGRVGTRLVPQLPERIMALLADDRPAGVTRHPHGEVVAVWW